MDPIAVPATTLPPERVAAASQSCSARLANQTTAGAGASSAPVSGFDCRDPDSVWVIGRYRGLDKSVDTSVRNDLEPPHDTCLVGEQSRAYADDAKGRGQQPSRYFLGWGQKLLLAIDDRNSGGCSDEVVPICEGHRLGAAAHA
jgi:hypothetical protein